MIAGVLEIQMMANMARLSDDMRRAERVVGDSMGKVEHSVAKAGRAMSSLGLGLSGALIADQMRRAVDAYTKIDAQLRLSTKSQQQYNQALSDVRRISGVAQSDISATTMLYTRLMNVMDGTGVSQGKLATVTETVSYGLKAFGATSAEAASASLQLSQAMGANRLGGEEFRAVMEAMPNVMKVLATSMGVPLGELRALSIAGKITAAEMVKAFGDPAIAAEFKRMALNAQTITGAWVQVRNEFTMLFGEFAKSSGITGATIASFKLLAESMRVLAQYIGDLVLIFGAWAALRVAQMIYGYVAALAASRAATLAAAQAELVRMNMTYGASAASVAATRTAYAQAAANTTVAGSLATMGRAMMAFALANAPMLALLALAAAVVTLKNSFEDSINPTGKFVEQIRGMGLEALIAARQMEELKLANMWFKDSFNERERRATEDRIRMLNAQIIAEQKLKDVRLPTTGEGDDHVSKMLKIATELKAQTAADADKLSHSEKVSLAWQQLKDKEKTAQEGVNYAVAQQAAIELDNLEAAKKAAEARDKFAAGVAESVVKAAKSGNVGQSILDDIQAAFEKNVLEPQIKATVLEAMPLFEFKDTALIGNTSALQANTAALSGQSGSDGASAAGAGGWWGLVIAAVVAFFIEFFKRASISFKDTMIEAKASNEGIAGSRRFRWEGSQFDTFGALGTSTTNTLNAAAQDTVATFAAVGDVMGAANVRTRDYNVAISTTGDAVEALSNGIGAQLVPALRTMSRDGETLAQTAERVTSTFKATNDFIVALGVSQGAAFGGFGLGSAAGREALIAASGGLQQFTQNAQGFVSKFLTPAEQLAPALDDVGRTFARLGIQGVSTNEQFADLVKQQMELGNTDVVAQLLSVADSFDAVTKSAGDANAELMALLGKDVFSTLTDYIRATNAGGAASGLIAGAVAGARGTMSAETTGTRQYVRNNPFVAPGTPDLGLERTGVEGFWDMVQNMMAEFFDQLLHGFSDMFVTIRDLFLAPFPSLDLAFKSLQNIVEQLIEPFRKLASAAQDAAGRLGGGMGVSGLWGGGGQAIGGGLNPLNWAKGGAFAAAGVMAFANGGAFTNGIYNTPTPFMFANGAGFSQGIMGEAGDEAIMPLERGADGRLGVSMNSGGGLVAEVRMLRASVERMDSNNTSGNIAISTATQRTYKVIDRWNGEGMPEVRTT